MAAHLFLSLLFILLHYWRQERSFHSSCHSRRMIVQFIQDKRRIFLHLAEMWWIERYEDIRPRKCITWTYMTFPFHPQKKGIHRKHNSLYPQSRMYVITRHSTHIYQIATKLPFLYGNSAERHQKKFPWHIGLCVICNVLVKRCVICM